MAYEGTNYDPVLRWTCNFGIAAMIAAVLFLGPTPVAEPAKSVVFGCYTTALAPPITLDAQGLRIEQAGFPQIGFHLERLKTGIVLTADAPIAAEVYGSRYRYSIIQPGEGLYLDFFKVIGGRRYGVFNESDLSRFTMLTRDGVYLPYEKASEGSCQTRPL